MQSHINEWIEEISEVPTTLIFKQINWCYLCDIIFLSDLNRNLNLNPIESNPRSLPREDHVAHHVIHRIVPVPSAHPKEDVHTIVRRHYGTVYRSQGTAEWVEGGQVNETKTFQYVREIWKPCNPTGHETVRGFTQCLNASTASNPLSNRQEDSCESPCTTAELVIDFRKLGTWREEVNNIQADFEHCTMTKLQLLQDVSGLQNYRILRNCWLESSLIMCRIQKMPRWKCRCLKSHPSSTLCTSRQVEGLRRPTAGMQMFFSNPWQEPAKHYDCGMSGTPQTFWTEKHKRWCCYKFRGDVWGPALYEHGFAENVGEKQPKSHGNKISISITIKIAIGGYAVCTIFRQNPHAMFLVFVIGLSFNIDLLCCPSSGSSLFLVFTCHLAPVLPQNRHRQEHLSHSGENSVTRRKWNYCRKHFGYRMVLGVRSTSWYTYIIYI